MEKWCATSEGHCDCGASSTEECGWLKNTQSILIAGTFRTSEYRKAIPDHVKVQVVLKDIYRGALPNPYEVTINARDLEYDHDPALLHRDYDVDAQDFIPPQHSVEHLFARFKADHLEKTTGRKAGAERTVTTRGSDVGEAARTKSIRDTEAIHDAAMASKRGDYEGAARILSVVKKKSRLKTKRKIPLRPFAKSA